jgi:hypothetical protein
MTGGYMIANHIHDALNQIENLRRFVLEKKTFKGYSGKVRMAGGVVALAGASLIQVMQQPANPLQHFWVWCGVLAVALALNYGALFLWFIRDPAAKHEIMNLIPAIDAVPALAVGAFITVALPLHGEYNLLVPLWMFLYGLVHIPYRLNLPKQIYFVGIFYIICGAVLLFFPWPFTNPWPMGVTFFVGEILGGWALMQK